MTSIVLTQSKQLGAPLDETEWKSLSSTICSNLTAGGSGLFLSQSAAALPESKQWALTDLYLEGATEGKCLGSKKPPAPQGNYYGSDIGWNIIYATGADLGRVDLEYRNSLMRYEEELVTYGRRYNVDVSLRLAAVDAYLQGGSGNSAVCADGWVSSSGGKQGACSHHGGLQ
ncbi:DUF3761 domain-containing protein [Arthrobacter sp. NicSoilC5]|uniref:DUF3761 domain-containing protein n=1 Tax=Arthrobacter sp. NicSoilC5 TaxID=2831000 RepID=UPI001CC4C3A7|nr:DUF3761 domain-containing protein [Arthrobacter sp. NicSoilC5]BCW78878.1 hypothetical protein NicSoilC5_08970 [Arthrobacter sp. NicSoilC5]